MSRGRRSKQLDWVHETLTRFMSPITARGITQLALKRANMTAERVESVGINGQLTRELISCSRLYVRDPKVAAQLQEALGSRKSGEGEPTTVAPVVMEVVSERDIVRVRSHARKMAEQLGFHQTDQIRISTAVSELARNIHLYAGRGRIRLTPRTGRQTTLEIVAEDEGPGITDVDAILDGKYVSKTGLGRGLAGCKAMMDEFKVDTKAGKGTTIRTTKSN